MSRDWTWRHAILKSKLQATTKHVLMVISVHMNDMGEGCYPSVKRISELASLSERAVCTHIDVAEEAGWLVVKKHGFNGQGWARHEYRPAWPEAANDNAWMGTIPRTIDTDEETKERARRIVRNDFYEGRISKGACIACHSDKTEAHHCDYANPRDVVWLCREHHRQFHAWEKRTERPSMRQRTERGAERTEPDDKNALNEVLSIELPIEHLSKTSKSKPTKATRRGSTTGIRLEELLRNSGGLPPTEWGEWANQHLGWDSQRISLEWDDFHDYWTSGNAVGGGLKADWPATWRGHCRRQAKNGRRGGGSGCSTGGNLLAAVSASVALRNGASRPGGGVDPGQASAGAAGADTRVERDSEGRRVIPF